MFIMSSTAGVGAVLVFILLMPWDCSAKISFVEMPEFKEVTEGETVSFSCVLRLTSPESGYKTWITWETGEGNLLIASGSDTYLTDTRYAVNTSKESSDASITLSSKLIISDVSEQDEGGFRCSLCYFSGNAGSTTSYQSSAGSLEISANTMPIPSCLLQPPFVNIGDSVKLTCVSPAMEPPLTLQWLSSNNPIGEPIKSSGEQDVVLTHQFNATLDMDDSSFVCHSSSSINSAGRKCVVGPLSVAPPPVPISTIFQIPPFGGSDIHLRCQVTGSPPFSYTWLLSSVIRNQVEDVHSETLIIKNIDSSDVRGVAICKVSDRYGQEETSLLFTIPIDHVIRHPTVDRPTPILTTLTTMSVEQTVSTVTVTVTDPFGQALNSTDAVSTYIPQNDTSTSINRHPKNTIILILVCVLLMCLLLTTLFTYVVKYKMSESAYTKDAERPKIVHQHKVKNVEPIYHVLCKPTSGNISTLSATKHYEEISSNQFELKENIKTKNALYADLVTISKSNTSNVSSSSNIMYAEIQK